MKRFGALTIFLILSMLFSFLGCKSKDNPVTQSGEVDQRLIGTWVRIDKFSDSPPVNISVTSFTITANKEMIENGWEFSTGKLIPYQIGFIEKLETASDGTFAFNSSEGLRTFTYSFDSIYLVLKNYYEIRYRRAKLLSIIFPAIPCSASFNFLDINYHIPPAGHMPSGYLEIDNAGITSLTLLTDSCFIWMRFNDFVGLGTYITPNDFSELSEVVIYKTGVAHTFMIAPDLEGKIVFESYDPVQRVYSGNFNFTVTNNTLYPDSITTFEVKNGKFVVPVKD